MDKTTKNLTFTAQSPRLNRLWLFFIATLLMLMVQGCQQTPLKSSQPTVNHSQASRQAALAELQYWRVKGKLVFKSSKQKKSVSLNWAQDSARSDIRLTTFLGISVLKMINDQHSATIQTDGKTVTSDDPQRLLKRTTGLTLPVTQLPHWMKGAINVNTRADSQQQHVWDKFNRLQQIRLLDGNFQPWVIDYLGYADVSTSDNSQPIQLPKKIRLSGNDIKIIITIFDWEFTRDD